VTNLDELIRQVNGRLEKFTGHQLNDAQKEALMKILDKSKGIVQMPTGSGKTRLAAAFIWALYAMGSIQEGDLVFYFTPRRVILGQTFEEFKKSLGVSSAAIKRNTESPFMVIPMNLETEEVAKLLKKLIWIKHKPTNLEELLADLLSEFPKIKPKKIGIIILTPQLLNLFFKKDVEKKNFNQDFNPVKAIILDEVHHTYWGDEISNAINRLLELNNSKFVIGLSATPVKEAVENVGGVLYSLSSRKAMEMGILVRKLKIYSTRTITHIPHLKSGERSNTTNETDQDKQWKFAIVERAKKYAQEIVKRITEEAGPLSQRVPKTLVVAANTKEANRLKEFLIKEIGKRQRKDPEELVYVAHYKEEEPIEVINEFKKEKEGVLVTVNMADIGFDDPNLEVLVIARPINTPVGYVQIRGRVLRKPNNSNNLKETKYALIIDFTESAKYEENVEEVERGEYAKTITSEELRRDLTGEGDVLELNGEVKIANYEVIEVSPGSTTKRILQSKPISQDEHSKPSQPKLQAPTSADNTPNSVTTINASQKKSLKNTHMEIIVVDLKFRKKCTIDEFPTTFTSLLKKCHMAKTFKIIPAIGFLYYIVGIVNDIVKQNFPDYIIYIEKSYIVIEKRS